MGDEKPDPLSDVIKGLGLILRAAKTAVERMPKKGLEEAVLETAREVGRAIENVAGAVEREVLGRRDPPPGGANRAGSPGDAGDDRTKEGEGPPKPPDAA